MPPRLLRTRTIPSSPMIHPLCPLLCGFALMILLPSTTPAQVVVEAPPANSDVKFFDFPGGTPEQLMTLLKKTYGTLGRAVTFEDKTNGDPLPPFKVFTNSPFDIVQDQLPELRGRLDYNGSTQNWVKLKFLPAKPIKPADPFQSSATGNEAKTPVKQAILFEFAGGTPVELVAALDRFFGCRLSEVTTVAPEMAEVKLPAVRMRFFDAAQVIPVLNRMSNNCAGTCGYWFLIDANGDDVHTTAKADGLIVTPHYDDRNPPPAILARDTAAGLQIRISEESAKKMQALENSLSTMSQTLEAMQKQLTKLEGKAP